MTENNTYDFKTYGEGTSPYPDILGTQPGPPTQISEKDLIMTPPEAAGYLRISVATLLRGSRLQEIPGFQVGRRLWRYRKSQLDSWLASSWLASTGV